jgi:putative transposase
MGACPLSDASITCRVTDASLISGMKQLQAENALLKRMYADIAMQNELVKEALAKK